jgi:CRP-like cAMP-binding protein
VQLKANQVLFNEGEQTNAFYFILAGVVSLQTEKLGHFGQGQIGTTVGEDYLFTGQEKQVSTCVGLEGTYLLEILRRG